LAKSQINILVQPDVVTSQQSGHECEAQLPNASTAAIFCALARPRLIAEHQGLTQKWLYLALQR
jgi:hypothetical protein